MNQMHNRGRAVAADQTSFDSEVIRSNRPVLVAFGTEWSRPCNVLEPVLDDVAAECEERLKVVKVNADDTPELSMWYDIQSIPTLLYFVHGSVWARIVGTASKSAILEKLETALENPQPLLG